MTKPDSDKVVFACSHCDAERATKPNKDGTPRIPKGWKRFDDEQLCDKCLKRHYCIRAVTLPVVGVLEDTTWESLREALHESWSLATGLCNWAITELAMADTPRLPDMDKLPKMPRVYLYGLAKEGFPQGEALDARTRVSLLNGAEARYRAYRYECRWKCSKALPSYRYPQPLPMPPASVKLSAFGDGRVQANVKVGSSRHHLLLAGGHQYRRQLAGVRMLMENPHLMCECSLYQASAGKGDHRNGANERNNGGGSKRMKRVMLKVVGYFPRIEQGNAGCLRVKTASDALLVAVTPEGDRIWTYNADHAKRMIAKHEAHLRRLSRLSDDRKAERRKPKRQTHKYREMLEDVSRKDRDRMTSLCHQVSASVVAFAKRQRARSILYSDAEKSFCQSFPWHKLKVLIEQKSRAAGLEFDASTAVAGNPPLPLEMEQGQ
jgi:hypothetical protein